MAQDLHTTGEYKLTGVLAGLLAIANKRREICIGVRVAGRAADIDANFGVRLVTDKRTRNHLTAEDALVVVAEHEL